MKAAELALTPEFLACSMDEGFRMDFVFFSLSHVRLFFFLLFNTVSLVFNRQFAA